MQSAPRIFFSVGRMSHTSNNSASWHASGAMEAFPVSFSRFWSVAEWLVEACRSAALTQLVSNSRSSILTDGIECFITTLSTALRNERPEYSPKTTGFIRREPSLERSANDLELLNALELLACLASRLSGRP